MPTVQETTTIGKPSLQRERERGDVQHQVCVCRGGGCGSGEVEGKKI